MAEQKSKTGHDDDEHEQENTNYRTPAEKSLTEIVGQDTEDESLRKYKEALLGSALGGNVIIDPKNPNKVLIQKLSLLVDGKETSIDLTRPAEEIKKEQFSLKAGCKYFIKIYFFVQRDIVCGLKYQQRVYKKGIPVDSLKQMMGSFGPKTDLQSFTTQEEEAPSGLLTKGSYKIKSKFTDDDKNEYANWEWHINVVSD